jgi:hypothetical protein
MVAARFRISVYKTISYSAERGRQFQCRKSLWRAIDSEETAIGDPRGPQALSCH